MFFKRYPNGDVCFEPYAVPRRMMRQFIGGARATNLLDIAYQAGIPYSRAQVDVCTPFDTKLATTWRLLRVNNINEDADNNDIIELNPMNVDELARLWDRAWSVAGNMVKDITIREMLRVLGGYGLGFIGKTDCAGCGSNEWLAYSMSSYYNRLFSQDPETNVLLELQMERKLFHNLLPMPWCILCQPDRFDGCDYAESCASKTTVYCTCEACLRHNYSMPLSSMNAGPSPEVSSLSQRLNDLLVAFQAPSVPATPMASVVTYQSAQNGPLAQAQAQARVRFTQSNQVDAYNWFIRSVGPQQDGGRSNG